MPVKIKILKKITYFINLRGVLIMIINKCLMIIKNW